MKGYDKSVKNSDELEKVEAENYSLESGLKYENRKRIGKMFNYINTFPLEEYEIALMRKDITGMAVEAEQRGETLNSVIGSDWRGFCNELIFASTGMKVPGGRNYLRIVGWYYEIYGWFSYISGIFACIGVSVALFTSGYGGVGRIGALNTPGWARILSAACILFIGIFFKTIGKKAKKYCGDSSKAAWCMKWAIIMLTLEGVSVMVNMILNVVTDWNVNIIDGGVRQLMQDTTILSFIFPILFIVGAKKNMKDS